MATLTETANYSFGILINDLASLRSDFIEVVMESEGGVKKTWRNIHPEGI